jgi:hypothetical protein
VISMRVTPGCLQYGTQGQCIRRGTFRPVRAMGRVGLTFPINSVFATSQSAAGPATTATATLDFGQRQLPADYVWPTHVETSWRPNNVCYFGSNTSPCP